MFYGIEQSPDPRHQQTTVRKLTSRKSALVWLRAKAQGSFAHADPEAARNWHRFRTVYEVKKSKAPHPATLGKMAREESTPSYPRTTQDALATWIKANGTEVKLFTPESATATGGQP